MVNRARPSTALLDQENQRLEDAVANRKAKQDEAKKADLHLRKVIRESFARGLSATYISKVTGLTRSRLYQLGRGASGE